MPPPPSDKAPPSKWLVLGTVSFYMVAAIAMVMANKWVLTKSTTPLFFLEAQLVIAVGLLALTSQSGFLKFPLRIDPATCKALAPMVALTVAGLNFNNLTLIFVDASFYQVARGLLLPITVALSSVMLHSRPSLNILVCCGIVTAGFFVGVLIDNPGGKNSAKAPSLWGVLFGLLSSCTTALHAVVIKKSLDAVNGSTLQLAWYSNVLAGAIMIPIIVLAGEVPAIFELLFSAPATRGTAEASELSTFLWGSAITGVFGFLINIAGFLSIKVTSPITHMVSGAARGVLQTFLAVLFFGDVITAGRGISIALILFGSIYYTWVKNQEAEAQKHRHANGASDVASKMESGEGRPRSPNGRRGDGYERVQMEEVKNEPSVESKA